MFVTGTASETGTDMSKAIAMKRRNDTQGNPSQIYEIYTRLTAGKTYQFVSGQNVPAHRYGGKDGKLQKAGAAIAVTVTAEYRIVVDLATMSYTATKIDKWSIVGTPISGEWGGDVALQYQGMGVWKGTVDLLKAGGFVFRANGDWGYLLKHVKNTDNKLVMENDATSQGLSFEDVQSANIGSYICTLDLSAAGFTYSFIKDPSVVEPLVTPDKLFLLANNLKVKEFTKNGDVFSTADYIALQAGVTYSLNSAADGSGKSYNLAAAIGETTSPDGNKVEAKTTIAAGAGAISVARDQAYMLSFDFSTSKLSWHYYNIFLFHWDNANNGWDARKELKMTYVHPYTYETTQSLTAAFDIKFISPWDKDFGSDAPASLAGNIIASGGANLLCIKTSGNYKAKIVLSPDYKTGTYSIVAQ
jgi:hypothetical protein